MTLIRPDVYIDRLKEKTYPELIRERNNLIKSIRDYEEAKLNGITVDSYNGRKPKQSSLELLYYMQLQYLSALTGWMSKLCNLPDVWEGRSLKEEWEKLDDC